LPQVPEPILVTGPVRDTIRGGRRSGGSAGQHVPPDGGAPGPGSQLDQVTQLVGDAQAVAAVIVGRVGVASGQRVSDPAVVPDLAHQGQAVSPDPQDSGAAGVDHGVGRDLVDRDHQVLRPAGADPLLDGAAADLVPQRREVLLAEGRRPRPRGRAGQRLAAYGPGYRGAAVVRARPPGAVLHDAGVGPPGIGQDGP